MSTPPRYSPFEVYFAVTSRYALLVEYLQKVVRQQSEGDFSKDPELLRMLRDIQSEVHDFTKKEKSTLIEEGFQGLKQRILAKMDYEDGMNVQLALSVYGIILLLTPLNNLITITLQATSIFEGFMSTEGMVNALNFTFIAGQLVGKLFVKKYSLPRDASGTWTCEERMNKFASQIGLADPEFFESNNPLLSV